MGGSAIMPRSRKQPRGLGAGILFAPEGRTKSRFPHLAQNWNLF
jgi:hypothetical protein